MVRSLLERLGPHVTFQRRLPQNVGGLPLYVSAGAALRYLKPQFHQIEPLLLEVAQTYIKPGMTVWDIGANIGMFAFAALGMIGSAGSVVAVEADPWLVELLKKSSQLAANRALPLQIEQVAISNQNGQAEFHIARRSRATNHLADSDYSTQTGGTSHTLTVPTLTLDHLLERCPRPPSLVKIDIEGAEAWALEGAHTLLSTIRPIVYCEVASETSDRVTAILNRHHYRLYDAETKQPLARAEWNTLALPA